MKRRLVVGLIALASVACSDQRQPNTICAARCNSSATFALATPLSGRELTISIGEEGGNLERIDCQPGDASVACIPVPMRLVPAFDLNGALQSVRLNSPTSGTLSVQILVDGTPRATGSFQYQAAETDTGPCGPCAGPKTFTIGN